MILNGGVLPNIYACVLKHGKPDDLNAEPDMDEDDERDDGYEEIPFISQYMHFDGMHFVGANDAEDPGSLQSVAEIVAQANLHSHLNFELCPAMAVKTTIQKTLNNISKAATTSELLAGIVVLRDVAVTSDQRGKNGGGVGVERDSVLGVVKAKKMECPELWTTEIASVFGELLRALPKQQGGGKAGGGEGKDGGAAGGCGGGREAIPVLVDSRDAIPAAFPVYDLLRLCATAGITRISSLITEQLRGIAWKSLTGEVRSAMLTAMARCGDGPCTILATDLSAINILGGGGATASVASKVDLSQRLGRAAGEFDWIAACESTRPCEDGGGGEGEKADDQAAGRGGGEGGDGGGWEVESADADSDGEEDDSWVDDDEASHYWREDPEEQKYPDRVGAHTAALVAIRMCQKEPQSVLFPFLPFSRLLLNIAKDARPRMLDQGDDITVRQNTS
jgi:hypothetical protein